MGMEAASVGDRRKGRRRRAAPQMNVTPLVDVVLVLLIIFMVITPLLAKQFWVHMPDKEDADAAPPSPADLGPIVVSVTPMEAVTDGVSALSHVSANTMRTRSRISVAAEASVRGMAMTNSSPPHLAKMSSARSERRTVSANKRSARSPASCP